MGTKKSGRRNIPKLTNVKSSSKIRVMPSIIHSENYKPLRGYITISQAAKILGKTRQATAMFMQRNGCKMIKIGSILIIHKSQLAKLKR